MSTLHWSRATNSQQPAGVALIIHGLNYRPDRMQPVIECLTGAGVDCLRLSLRGHGDNYLPQSGYTPEAARLESFRSVTCALWLGEVTAAYAIVRARAQIERRPVLLCGYSLGALLACTLAAQMEEDNVRLLLFSPAIALPPRRPSRWLAKWAPRTVLPSIAPVYYRANRGSPGAAYHAIYETLALLESCDLQRLNRPALVFADERDEMISFAGVQQIAGQLSRWTLCRVQKTPPAAGNVFHHLVIGNPAAGVDAWRSMSQRIAEFVQTPVGDSPSMRHDRQTCDQSPELT